MRLSKLWARSFAALAFAAACSTPGPVPRDTPTSSGADPARSAPTPGSASAASALPAGGPSAVPAPTVVPPVVAHDPSRWHPPTDHEHGDPPPGWIAAAGYEVRYDGLFSTSSMENTHKHAGHKGFAARFHNVDLYFRVHASSVPMDRAGRHHSYEVFARDASRAVSHWQGWYDVGDSGDDRHPMRQGNPGDRPHIRVVDVASWREGGGDRCEWWYPEAPAWSWTWSWRICDTETLWERGETIASVARRTGGEGLERRLNAAWLAEDAPRGRFWATARGELVDGPTDRRCAVVACLEQVIQRSMQRLRGPGNVAERVFPGPGRTPG